MLFVLRSICSTFAGDRILVRRPGMADGQWFEGGVHVVRQAEVGLRFNPAFRGHTPAQRYEVHFKLNRYPVRRQHQAMDAGGAEARVFFPDRSHRCLTQRPFKTRAGLRLYNALIDQNTNQLQAVVSIVQQPPGSVPFIVFGPCVESLFSNKHPLIGFDM
jgi:helicase MOV-10